MSKEKADTEPKRHFIREIIAKDLSSGKHARPITRFPPEPNGYLHLGHAKSICLNFGLAEEFTSLGARCHLRFDDTNPEKEETIFVESIKKDIKWLGFDWGEHLYFASDYFNFFYESAIALIKKGLAYVDEQTLDEIRENRGTLTNPGKDSPFRDRPVEESLALFESMKKGEVEEGKAVLRAKIDMTSSNLNLRDPVLYRILKVPHHHIGAGWNIYPMYDFAHPLEDALENITHSLCTLEFENHRPLYEWVVEHCPVTSQPRQIEFARLNFTYTVMSKRKLAKLVQEKVVDGWDDPRLPTLSGVRRRGFPPEAIRNTCEHIGITKQNALTDIALLEHEVRSVLNKKALRRMGVLAPLKVILSNIPEGETRYVEVPNNPEEPEAGNREVPLSREIWIEREDFELEPPPKYFRLKPGGAVRLRGANIIRYTGHNVDSETGLVTEVYCEALPDTIGQPAPEGVQCRAAIHWLSVPHAKGAEVRLYDRLFLEENPDAHPEGFLATLNPDSLKTISNAWVEPILGDIAAGETVQFERMGYFCADLGEHVPGQKLVFNRTISLRDSWAKKQKKSSPPKKAGKGSGKIKPKN